ncbi:MAG: TetR/AcrR family transcriptional regulator [Actinomycetota bacterium]|nr:TetR/AcrR family transcriptional regulator [Actinomycetota bacterium]
MTDLRESVAVDGRTARRERNRVAVLDAVLELFSEGDLDPSPGAVARRSGVSLRSVYRYVADREGLAREAIGRHQEKIAPLFVLHELGEGSFEERVGRFVAARMTLHDAIASTHLAARLRAPASPIIKERVETGRETMRAQLDRQFAPELRLLTAATRRNVATAADALTQLEGIDYFRLHCGLSSRVTRDVLVDALTRLLQTQEEA